MRLPLCPHWACVGGIHAGSLSLFIHADRSQAAPTPSQLSASGPAPLTPHTLLHPSPRLCLSASSSPPLTHWYTPLPPPCLLFTGSSLYTFSFNRDTYQDEQAVAVAAQLVGIQAEMHRSQPVMVRAVCSQESGLEVVMRAALDTLQALANTPLSMTLEVSRGLSMCV